VAWIDKIKGKVISLDTAPMIYYLEEHLTYASLLDIFFDALDNNECSMTTSVITLLEGLVMPVRVGDTKLIRKWYDFLYTTDNLETVEITPDVAEVAARLRAVHTKLKTPDAIQVATALYKKADFFLTNDKDLASISGVNVLVLDDLKVQLLADKPKTDS
jgi:predicted nucleic acid-binding protein